MRREKEERGEMRREKEERGREKKKKRERKGGDFLCEREGGRKGGRECVCVKKERVCIY